MIRQQAPRSERASITRPLPHPAGRPEAARRQRGLPEHRGHLHRKEGIIVISLGRRSVALLAAASLLLGGCASEGGGDTGKAASKTIEWWHIQNIEPMLPVWQALANE